MPDSAGFYFYATERGYDISKYIRKNNWETELINPNASLPGFDQVIYP
jgi:hypothetical protein